MNLSSPLTTPSSLPVVRLLFSLHTYTNLKYEWEKNPNNNFTTNKKFLENMCMKKNRVELLLIQI